MFETVTKEPALDKVLDTPDHESSDHEISQGEKRAEDSPVARLGQLEASIREHRLFKAQREKHVQEEEEQSGSLSSRVLGGRKRSNAIVGTSPFATTNKNKQTENLPNLDNKTKSLITVRDKVAPTISDGSFKTALTYVEKEGFFAKLKDKVSSIKEKAKEGIQEKLTDDLGETLEGGAEKLEKALSYRESLREALANGNVEQVKALIFQKAGGSAPVKFMVNAIEWICRKFAGKKESDVARGVGILENISSFLGPIGGGIQTVQKTYKSVKTAYELFKKRHETTTEEKVTGAGEAITHALEAAGSGVETISGILDRFDIVKSVLGTAVPIIGSAISIAINAVSIIVRTYQAIKAFFLKSKASSMAKSFLAKASMGKFFVEKSKFFRKTSSFDDKAAKETFAELKEKRDSGTLSDEEKEEYENLENYFLYNNLQSYNRKRGVRAVILVGEKLVNVGAEIANIVGVATQGAGVAVGTAMKAVVTVEQIGRKAYNKTKQLGRDHLSSRIGIFDKNKTTKEKMKTYYENAAVILSRIGHLPTYRHEDNDVKERYSASQRDLELANCSVYTLAEKKNVTDIRDFLIGCMKKRE